MQKRILPLAFIILWIVPVGWVGLMRSNYPLYPAWLAPLFRVSGIFETPPSRWRIFFIESQDRQSGTWQDVDEKLLFASTPLGNRTRFQQLMNEIEDSQPGQLSNMLAWITNRLSRSDHSLSPVKAIRIVHFGISSETLIKCNSLSDIYKAANATKIPRIIDASTNVPSLYESP